MSISFPCWEKYNFCWCPGTGWLEYSIKMKVICHTISWLFYYPVQGIELVGKLFQMPDNAPEVIVPVDSPWHRLGLEAPLPGDFRRADDTQYLKTLAVYLIVTRDEGRSIPPVTGIWIMHWLLLHAETPCNLGVLQPIFWLTQAMECKKILPLMPQWKMI